MRRRKGAAQGAPHRWTSTNFQPKVAMRFAWNAAEACALLHIQALLAQGDAAKAVPDLQQAVRLSAGDDAAVMQEVLDRARSQLPADTAKARPWHRHEDKL